MSGHDETPPVGSLGEEAVKLLDALKSWADETGSADATGTRTGQGASILAEINEHIEKVIQMYLRNEYETITEYNLQAGMIAEAEAEGGKARILDWTRQLAEGGGGGE